MKSFANIASGRTQIIYSTHSHYMINPEWLNQAFIVSNTAVEYFDFNANLEIKRNPRTNVKIDRYRSFVGSNPDKLTYFQPVLDKLAVVPSKIDTVRPSVIVEGKGDYLLLEYGRRVLLSCDSDIAIVPTRGTTGVTELVGLLTGWSAPFMVCLDSDKDGKKAAKELREHWAISQDRVFDLHDVDKSFTGKYIEDILHQDDLDMISEHYGISERPNKSQIQLYFSERLATREVVALSEKYRRFIKLFSEKILTLKNN